MFSFTPKQNFWVNLILSVVMVCLFLSALVNFVFTWGFTYLLSLLLYGVFGYLSLNALYQIWRNRAYPFTRKGRTNRW